MKCFKKIAWFVLGLFLLLCIYVVVKFQVDDMTLYKGEVNEFNNGWILTGEDGSAVALNELPFSGESKPGELIIIENRIPEEFWGMSMSFLSADKKFTVFIDGEKVYEFGMNDKRSFGRTPGSVVNFIDIPADLTTGDIRIEMVSPYQDYAAKISDITVGKRDVLILKLFMDNAVNLFCGFAIIICGIGFVFLFLIQRVSGQRTEGIMQISGYCIVAAIYYFIETKTLSIFYGNQTLYSVLVFLCLMFMPLLLAIYYGSGIMSVYKKRWNIILGLICTNIFFQVAFQLLNIFDFMDMAFVSHALITLTILVIAKSYLDYIRKNSVKGLMVEVIALIFMTAGGTIDILRMYLVGVGDMGKFSRFGTTAFSVIMLYKHFRQVVMGYANNIEENARLLKQEMEKVEKKNEELKRASELAEEAKQEALAANDAKGKFLAHMSHEIRTPINAVLGMDTMILRETKDAQIKEYALDIQNAGQSLLALINDILDFSKIESGKMEIISVEYDLSSMVHDISNMISAKISSKKLKLHILADEKLPSRLLGDDVRIRQVLVNLLNNAVKYTNEGSVTLRIDGNIQEDKVILDFSVEDTGIGIKEEDISKLFHEFERIEEKRNRNVEGTGLGINITTQLLLLMGSRLNVESVYGKGSRFYFTLEQQVIDSTPIGNLEERIRQKVTEYDYMEVFSAPDAQILVVDDNVINLKVFMNLLKATKVNVDVAGGGLACLEMVCKKHYDLIFLDHMMPDLDGISTLHQMRELADNQCRETPVVALTANAITGAREMYLAEGFDAFLSKPINPEKLEQMILMLLPRELLQFEVKEAAEEIIAESAQIDPESHKDEELPIIDGLDWDYGFMHLPDKEVLLDTIADFYNTIDLEAENLERMYEEIKSNPEMVKQYRIKVHAMKSSANLIGATVLGGMARVLEKAANDNNPEIIDNLTPIFLKEWRIFKESLKECINDSEEKRETIEDHSVILAYLQMLKIAMMELDIDGMDQNMDELKKFIYPADTQKDMEQLAGLVTNLDSEQAVVLIEKIMNRMKVYAE